MHDTPAALRHAAILLCSVCMSVYPATIVWTGAASTPQWRVAANWAGDALPGSSDTAVFDATSTRGCLIDQPIDVGGLVVRNTYTGRLVFRAPFTVQGPLVLRDTVAIQYNTHEYSHIRGSPVDLSSLRGCLGGYTGFSIDLDAPAGTLQRLIPPTDTSVRITQLRSYGHGTVSIEGDLNVDMFDASADQTIQWNGHRVRAGVFAHGAQARSLGGCEFTIWSYVSWSPSGFGQSKNFSERTNGGLIELAPERPWKLNLLQNAPLAGLWSDPSFVPGNTAITGARVGNCDASGGTPVRALDCANQGGNIGIAFEGQVGNSRSSTRAPGVARRQPTALRVVNCRIAGSATRATLDVSGRVITSAERINR